MKPLMRGLYFDGDAVKFRRDLPVPAPAPGETRLRVRLAGICDTDVQIARGYMGFRGVIGHEFVGESADGRRVAGEINNACRSCETCLAGRPTHCPRRTVLGILGHDGAMAEFVCVPESNLYELPDSVDDERAVFVEPLAAAVRISEQLQLRKGVRLAVLGDGKLGLLCAWVLRRSVGELTLIGKHPDKLRLAGPDVSTAMLDDVDAMSRDFEIVVDCTGSASGFPTALRLVRPMGTVVLKTTVAGEYPMNLAPLVIDEIRVVGSRCGPFDRAIELLRNHEVDPRPLIERVFPMEEAEVAFSSASRRGARKVLLKMT